MKNIKYEYIQRISSHYVGSDCIQIMLPHLNGGITVFNSDEMTYHYKPNSCLFVNKYASDERREQFPYSHIPTHKSRFRGKKIEYINQLFDFNRVYIEIADGIIKEDYAIKDGDEALLATKYIQPNQEPTRFMNREEVEELMNSANGGVYSPDGGFLRDISLPSNEKVLDWYKEQLIKRRKNEQSYYFGNGTDKYLTEYFYKSVDKVTIDDVPEGITLFDDVILVSVEENEIKSIKAITVKFMGADRYMVEFYDFPITIYSLEHMKQLEQTNSRKTPEPRFPRFLNSKINSEDIKKEKKHVLSLIHSKKEDD